MPVSAKGVEPVCCHCIVYFVHRLHRHCTYGHEAQQESWNLTNLYCVRQHISELLYSLAQLRPYATLTAA